MEKDIITENILNKSNSPEREKVRAQRQILLEEKREKERKKKEAAERNSKLLRKYIAIVLFCFLVMLVLFGRSVIQIVELKAARDEAQANLDKLQSQIEELEETLSIVTTPEYIENQARVQLRMIYPNETYVIMEDDTVSEE